MHVNYKGPISDFDSAQDLNYNVQKADNEPELILLIKLKLLTMISYSARPVPTCRGHFMLLEL